MAGIPDSFPSAEVQIVGKPAEDVKRAVLRVRQCSSSGCKTPHSAFCNRTTRDCIFTLDTTSTEAHNPGNFSGRRVVQLAQGWTGLEKRKNSESTSRVISFTGGNSVQYLPGWTVQCINPECAARGHWLRAGSTDGELCSNCSSPLHNVPPPLAPRLRMRPRSLGSYRPSGRPMGRR